MSANAWESYIYTDTDCDNQGYPKLWKSFDMGATWTSSPIMWDTEGSNVGAMALSADGGTLMKKMDWKSLIPSPGMNHDYQHGC